MVVLVVVGGVVMVVEVEVDSSKMFSVVAEADGRSTLEKRIK